MATYRTIAASEVDPDSPVTATLMSALADNPTAIAEGASGAPRVEVDAFAGAVAGDTTLFKSERHDVVGSNEETIPTSYFRATTSGTVRVRVTDTAATGTLTLRIRKNLTQVASSSSSPLTADISYVAGDVIKATVQDTGVTARATCEYRTDATRVLGGV